MALLYVIQKKIKNISEKKLNEIEIEVEKFAGKVVADAKRLVPTDKGILKNSIHSETTNSSNEIVAKFIIGKTYGAYVEFGTGDYAAIYVPTLPEKWQKLAKEYKGTHKIKGQHQKPYLYPSFNKNKSLLLDIIKKKFR
jgi:hypothetical protein